MWASVKAASVKQENLVSLMQVDMLQLSVTQTQLDNLCLQSTLIIGFTLSILSGETLKPLVDDSEQSCIWKSTAALAFGHILFYMIATCIGCCIVNICLISYLKQHSQEAALTVSTGAAAAITRRHIHLVNTLFVTAMICFSIAAAFLVILFVGFPKRHHYGGPIMHDEDIEGLVEMPDGSWTITCLSPLDEYANKERDVHGIIIASINTSIFIAFAVFGTYKFLVRAEAAVSSPPRPPPRLRPPARAQMIRIRSDSEIACAQMIRRSFEPKKLLAWYVEHEARRHAMHARVERVTQRLKHHRYDPSSRLSAAPSYVLEGVEPGVDQTTAADDDSVTDSVQ